MTRGNYDSALWYHWKSVSRDPERFKAQPSLVANVILDERVRSSYACCVDGLRLIERFPGLSISEDDGHLIWTYPFLGVTDLNASSRSELVVQGVHDLLVLEYFLDLVILLRVGFPESAC